MILVTGGLGFIGSHTTRALLDLGERCLLVQRTPRPVPEFLTDEVTTESLDIADRDALLALGKRYPIDRVVHLAGAAIGALPLLDELRSYVNGLVNVLEAAREWDARRVVMASTIGVYGGVPGPALTEDAPLAMSAHHAIEASKKIGEIVGSLTGAVNMRISAAYGPLGRSSSRFFALPGMVHAAVRGERLPRPVPAGDGLDTCYVKDIGRAVALLATAERLNHDTYNVGAGRATTNREVADAIRAVLPGADLALTEGSTAPALHLDITRLREDTGYRPRYDIGQGIADYVSWLTDQSVRGSKP
jgi:UDP-glucose 4-epimerase